MFFLVAHNANNKTEYLSECPPRVGVSWVFGSSILLATLLQVIVRKKSVLRRLSIVSAFRFGSDLCVKVSTSFPLI